jgi:long-chain acyl-CoA synthetase
MSYRRAFEILHYQVEHFACDVAVAGKEATDAGPAWREYSSAECARIVDKYSHALLELDIQPGDAVALIAANCPEWLFLDIAVQQIGGVTVPIHATVSDTDFAFILGQTKARLCFVRDRALHERVVKLKEDLPGLQAVYPFLPVDGAQSWEEVIGEIADVNTEAVGKRKANVSEADLATIIYTSGTTGTPKGAMLSHRNIVSNVDAIRQAIPLEPYGRSLSFLPLSHSLERLVTYSLLASGVALFYLDSLDTIVADMQTVRPDYFTAVPRLLEKQHEALVARGTSGGWLKRAVFAWALRIGVAYDEHAPRTPWRSAGLWLARRTVFDKWRGAVGGKVRLIMSGGAALQPRLTRLFGAARMVVIEGYGLTETTTFVTVNRVNASDRRVGTVGLPVPGVELRIADDGEILVRGPNVMVGYYQRPDLTAEVIDDDGWFHTGDLGELVDGRFLKITGRKKDLFKLSGGEYVAPQWLEHRYVQSPYIEDLMIVGEGRKHVAALIVPVFGVLAEWCEERGLPHDTPEAMVAHPEVVALFTAEIDSLSRDINEVEQVKRFTLLAREWSTDAGELSVALKKKRQVIREKYRDEIDGCYEAGD